MGLTKLSYGRWPEMNDGAVALAMGIGNSLRLWELGNPIVANSGIFYADDCSLAIGLRIWETLQGGSLG